MKYDVIVVGGGAAGSTLASRLAEDTNTSVLLLEAGNDYPDVVTLPDDVKFGGTRYAEAQDSIHNWALRGTITEEQGEIHVAQGKVIGGGSSINGQAMQRGFPEDFDDWAARGNDEWSYDKVLPFYRKMENDMDIQDDYHGSDGPMPVRRRRTGTWADIQKAFYDACLAEGYPAVEDTNGPNPDGRGRVADQQPGRHPHERGHDPPQPHAAPAQPDGARQCVRAPGAVRRHEGCGCGGRKRRRDLHRRRRPGRAEQRGDPLAAVAAAVRGGPPGASASNSGSRSFTIALVSARGCGTT